jgi:hypothetical protein
MHQSGSYEDTRENRVSQEYPLIFELADMKGRMIGSGPQFIRAVLKGVP